MKKYIPVLSLLIIIHYSCSQFKDEKQTQIESFKSEMTRLNDSSLYYFDKGIKLLKEGVDRTEISAVISPKLAYFLAETNKKSRGFYTTAKKLKLSEAAYDAIFKELSEMSRATEKKYKYLFENGVKMD